ncbi:MAG: AbrB/MazE/SpoVT family DNA-binding domain-containing protein, partial [Promicromonosporaceae bacterium]|nr:AbrB/MazE/SpoVT family DNA-binding domain-containing protein [Promicromonosporaceae bacterium]
TAKGQITLKKDILAALGLRPGEKVIAEPQETGGVLLRPARKPTDWAEMTGLLHREDAASLSVEEMNVIISKGWAGEL